MGVFDFLSGKKRLVSGNRLIVHVTSITGEYRKDIVVVGESIAMDVANELAVDRTIFAAEIYKDGYPLKIFVRENIWKLYKSFNESKISEEFFTLEIRKLTEQQVAPVARFDISNGTKITAHFLVHDSGYETKDWIVGKQLTVEQANKFSFDSNVFLIVAPIEGKSTTVFVDGNMWLAKKREVGY
jgi:hypothetical protein